MITGFKIRTEPKTWLGLEQSLQRQRTHPTSKWKINVYLRLEGKKAEGQFHLCFLGLNQISKPLLGIWHHVVQPKKWLVCKSMWKISAVLALAHKPPWPRWPSSPEYSRDWETCCLVWPSRSAWRQKWPLWLRSTTPQRPHRRCNAHFQKRRHHSEPGKTKGRESPPSVPDDHQSNGQLGRLVGFVLVTASAGLLSPSLCTLSERRAKMDEAHSIL